MKPTSLGLRLTLGFLIVAVLPMAGLAWFYLHSFEQSLTTTVLQNISSIADKKSDQIEHYIDERLADAKLAASQSAVSDALLVLAEEYRQQRPVMPASLAQRVRKELTSLGERGTYHDVLLIDAHGNVVFSLQGEADLGTNLLDGPYRDSGLAAGFRQAMTFLHIDLTRFTPYAPSGNEIAAFSVAPVLANGKPLGAIALQVNLSTLMPVVTDRTGLGASGETVLAVRENAYARYTVELSRLPGPAFSRTVALNEVATPMQRALSGEHGRGITRDYAGHAIAASWHHLPALNWGMVVKIDVDEALAPLYQKQKLTVLVFLLFLLLSTGAGILLGRRFMRNERTIALQEARYRAMFDSMNDGVALYRPTADGQEFIVLDINPAGEQIAGVKRNAVLGQPSRIAFPGLEASGIFAAFLRIKQQGGSESIDLTDYHDGAINLWVENEVIRLPEGEILSVFKDVTERRQVEESLQLYARIFEHSGEAIMVTDHENQIIAVNPAFTRQTGYALHEIAGKNPKLLASGRTPQETYRLMWAALQERSYWQGELWDRNRSGSIYPKWAAISAIRNEHGAITHYIASFTDITERKVAEERIEHLAHHDSLTGLFNRYNLEIRLSQSLLTAHREQEKLAVLFIDLDRFKVINDTLGHHVGDLLLIEVARRLRECVRESDIVARQGGDEFVVVINALDHMDRTTAVAGKILHALAQPYLIGGDRLHTSPSIGISIYPDDGLDAGTLMKHADAAMYYAKEQGRNNLQYFTAALNEAAGERLQLERELRVAIEQNQFELHYQPQFVADSANFDRPFAVEALIRWRHPKRGLIPPIRFIPIAEETGMIEVIGDWVLHEACRQLALWKTEDIGPRRIAVNLSAHQLRNPKLVSNVAKVLENCGLQHGELELEITESVAMSDPAGAIEKLQALRALGVTLAIDDFGTGYSSLAYLKRLPIQVLKLDREFVRDIETDENDAAISAATITLAHSLGLKVVAEGIETEGQSRFLREHRCDFLQGYLYGRPEPASVLNERWRKSEI
jgi:diguanylate cyclase (GGDEF)-like protein/PAS domain S-box-containing protein